jgi:hypothetical protein
VAGIVTADPIYPSDKTDVSNDSGIPANDLVERNNRVYLTDALAERIAKDILNLDAVDTYILPVFKAEVTSDGQIAQVTYKVTGRNILAQFPDDANLIGMTSVNTGKAFTYVNAPADFDDMTFTIMRNGVIYDGEINPNDEYDVVVFIKDGGVFDLDGIANGEILSAVFFASERTRKGSSGGCATYGYFAFILLGVVPFVLRKRQ